MLVTTIVGFITVFQVVANAGGLELRHWTAWIISFALAAALALTLMVGPVLDRFNVPVAETWGILALHLLAVTSFASAAGPYGLGDRPLRGHDRGAGRRMGGSRNVERPLA